MVSSILSSRFERAWSPSSREDIVYLDRGQLGLDNATEAYEDALDGVLYEILDEHLVAALRQPWVGPTTKPQSTTLPEQTGAMDYSSNVVE
jgi:hypothetical protein